MSLRTSPTAERAVAGGDCKVQGPLVSECPRFQRPTAPTHGLSVIVPSVCHCNVCSATRAEWSCRSWWTVVSCWQPSKNSSTKAAMHTQLSSHNCHNNILLVTRHDSIIQEGGVDVVAVADSNVFLAITEQHPALWMLIRVLCDIPMCLP